MTTKTKRPLAEANRITKLLELGATEADVFPVDVRKIALELTPAFNPDPITIVKGGSMDAVDGALVKHETSPEWAILYNENITNAGRKNFTLAHELGHYMVHRHLSDAGRFYCTEKDILGGNVNPNDVETEANAFAATLLMPNKDFRNQIKGHKFNFDLISHCADRYEVSLTAAIIKWLDITDKPAIAILSEDGFMHWSRSNNQAFRFGKYFATRKNTIPIPTQSMAAIGRYSAIAREGVRHKPSVWFPDTETVEFTIHSEEHGKTLTVLMPEVDNGYKLPAEFDEDSELLVDTYTNFVKNGQARY